MYKRDKSKLSTEVFRLLKSRKYNWKETNQGDKQKLWEWHEPQKKRDQMRL